MKKIYMIPVSRLVVMSGEQLIAESLGVDTGTTVDTQYVKEDNNSQSRYNVRDDDWSK